MMTLRVQRRVTREPASRQHGPAGRRCIHNRGPAPASQTGPSPIGPRWRYVCGCRTPASPSPPWRFAMNALLRSLRATGIASAAVASAVAATLPVRLPRPVDAQDTAPAIETIRPVRPPRRPVLSRRRRVAGPPGRVARGARGERVHQVALRAHGTGAGRGRRLVLPQLQRRADRGGREQPPDRRARRRAHVDAGARARTSTHSARPAAARPPGDVVFAGFGISAPTLAMTTTAAALPAGSS